MMIIGNLDELKELILFCKKHKVQAVDVHGIKFELSAYALTEDIEKQYSQSSSLKEELSSSKSLIDTEEQMSPEEYEKLLFHSSNP